MDVGEIVDQESLEAWLNSLPQGTDAEKAEAQRWAVLFAHRAAMRVLPVFWRWSLTERTRKDDLTAIIVLWPNLISGVAGTKPTPLIQTAAAYSGADASDFAARDFDYAAVSADVADPVIYAAASADSAACAVADSGMFYAAYAAYASTNSAAADPAWKAIHYDCAALEAGKSLNDLPLWPAENPLASLWSETRKNLLAQGPGWHFWVTWYDNALNGTPQDWPLLTKIALIDPEDWEKGADHVNALIAEIVRDHIPEIETPAPRPPEFDDAIRSHLQLVLAVPEPSRQSADYLRVQFEKLEHAYRLAVNCPNETPEELEPIVTLARTFGQIAILLDSKTDKDTLIIALQARIETLEATNASLIAAASGPKASLMRDIFVGTLSSAAGGAAAAALITYFGFVGGPAVADGIAPLYDLITPQGPYIDLSPSIPIL